MSYQSPIDIIQSKMQQIIDSTNKQLEDKIDDAVYQAVIQVGIDVDKNELLKALAYDRRQYQKGYNDRDREIVRCKECLNSKNGLTTKEDVFYGMIMALSCLTMIFVAGLQDLMLKIIKPFRHQQQILIYDE